MPDLHSTLHDETLKLISHPQLKGLSPTQIQMFIQLVMSLIPQIINIFNPTPTIKDAAHDLGKEMLAPITSNN